MATVKITPYLLSNVRYMVEDIWRKSQPPLPNLPESCQPQVADELYELLLPSTHEKQICDLLPDYAINKVDAITIQVVNNVPGNSPVLPRPRKHSVYAPLSQQRMYLNGRASIRSIPGIEELKFINGTTVEIIPSNDGNVIQQPNLRDFVDKTKASLAEYDEYRQGLAKAQSDMESFLLKYTTLNKAVKDFGPALLDYMPPNIVELYKSDPVPRKKRAKVTPPEVNIDYLVAAAGTSRLQLHS